MHDIANGDSRSKKQPTHRANKQGKRQRRLFQFAKHELRPRNRPRSLGKRRQLRQGRTSRISVPIVLENSSKNKNASNRASRPITTYNEPRLARQSAGWSMPPAQSLDFVETLVLTILVCSDLRSRWHRPVVKITGGPTTGYAGCGDKADA